MTPASVTFPFARLIHLIHKLVLSAVRDRKMHQILFLTSKRFKYLSHTFGLQCNSYVSNEWVNELNYSFVELLTHFSRYWTQTHSFFPESSWEGSRKIIFLKKLRKWSIRSKVLVVGNEVAPQSLLSPLCTLLIHYI